jgi:hypothetical protein
MTEKRKTYKCKECNQTVVLDNPDEIPVCCNQTMEIELPQCQAVHPQMARPMENEEPCDDGRGGQGS